MRAFLAIDLPEEIRAALRQKQKAFATSCPEARWTQSAGIHLTLKFLGKISEAQIRDVSEALIALGAFASFKVKVKGYGFFPDARRPRVFWAGIEAPPALGELANRVEDAMDKLGFAREQRKFNPHLTLARFKTPQPQPALADAVAKDQDQSLGEFDASELFLFESKLSPHGAEYLKVARFPQP